MRRGVRCSFCGTFTGPFSQAEGLFTVLIRRLCLEGRQIQPDTLPDLHDSGDPWERWGARSTASASGSSAPGSGNSTPRPSIPASQDASGGRAARWFSARRIDIRSISRARSDSPRMTAIGAMNRAV
jgi:hypothetical protein